MEYKANDIETLSFRDAIRKRIEMYMGSADNQGVIQCAREIISNSIDEAMMGFGKKITITLGENNRLRVEDEGRGCPFGIREDGTEALEAIYMTPHSGGKFSDKTYQSVIGMNGIGGKGVALSSQYFKVDSFRDGEQATLILEEGLKTSFKITPALSSKHGTIVEFIPSTEVYHLEAIHINIDDLKDLCKNWAYLNKNITFVLVDEVNKKTFTYMAPNGLLDLVKDNVKNPIHPTPIYLELTDGANQIEIALQWTKDREHSYVFTNGLHNVEGGTSLTGMKMAITRFMKKQFKGEFDGDMARTGLFYAVSCKIPNPSFANQTKTKINNPELNGLAQKAATNALENFMNGSRSEFNQVIDFLSKERKAEEAADKARMAILNHQKETTEARKKKFISNDKLFDAEVLGEESILLLVEGNSAAASMSLARDTKKYGILGLRGKIINCLSAPVEEILENEEVKIFLLASGIDITSYNPKKLRYGKIAICVDADDDGCHIACLIMALLQRLAPQFLKENRLYWLKAPLYKIEKGKDVQFFFNEEELSKSKIKGDQTRFKGLGQMTARDTKASMFAENQRLEPIVWSEEGANLLDELMGEDVEPRKEFIFNEINFEHYGEL